MSGIDLFRLLEDAGLVEGPWYSLSPGVQSAFNSVADDVDESRTANKEFGQLERLLRKKKFEGEPMVVIRAPGEYSGFVGEDNVDALGRECLYILASSGRISESYQEALNELDRYVENRMTPDAAKGFDEVYSEAVAAAEKAKLKFDDLIVRVLESGSWEAYFVRTGEGEDGLEAWFLTENAIGEGDSAIEALETLTDMIAG